MRNKTKAKPEISKELLKTIVGLMPKIKDQNSQYSEQELVPIKAFWEKITGLSIGNMLNCGGKLCVDVRRSIVNYMASYGHVKPNAPKKEAKKVEAVPAADKKDETPTADPKAEDPKTGEEATEEPTKEEATTEEVVLELGDEVDAPDGIHEVEGFDKKIEVREGKIVDFHKKEEVELTSTTEETAPVDWSKVEDRDLLMAEAIRISKEKGTRKPNANTGVDKLKKYINENA